MSLHLQFKSRINSKLSLSLSNPSLATNSSLCSQLQTKRRFPSQYLNKHIYATSHTYQTCQLTNGGQVEHARILYIRPHFQPENSFNIGIQQKTHLQQYSSRPQESPQQYQEESVRSLHIKTDSQSVSEGVIRRRPRKGVGLSVTVQKGVTSSDSNITTLYECTGAADL